MSLWSPQLSGDIAEITEKLKDIEELKLAAAKDSMGDAAAGVYPTCICMYTVCIYMHVHE